MMQSKHHGAQDFPSLSVTDFTMHVSFVSLTHDLENRVRAKVQSGLYNNASEMIREALRFM